MKNKIESILYCIIGIELSIILICIGIQIALIMM